MSHPHRQHAIVIGASFMGLLAARVLSNHFERVTIIERDPIHDQPESRKGQPQTRHLHGILASGHRILEQLFPGLEQTLVDGGATVADVGEAIRWYHYGGYKVQHTCGFNGIVMSRPFLEWHIRRRIGDLPNVTFTDDCAVSGLAVSADDAQIDGVRLRQGKNGQETETITADLVVDACGRGSPTPKWLVSLGYDAPPEEEVKIRLGYATRMYRRKPEHLVGALGLFVFPTPPAEKRVGYLFPIEEDRWLLTTGGWAGDYPPGDEDAFNAFIRSLPAPDIQQVIDVAEPLSDVVTYRFPSNLRRRYEQLQRFPDGYLVMGDALASFNPVYAQGMSSAAMQAVALDEVLSQSQSRPLWQTFFKRAAKIVDLPWQLAVGEDFRYPETEGKKPFGTGFINGYVSKVHHATQHDTVVYGQFLRVMNLLDPPTSLMHPRIMWRVLRGG